MGAGKPPLMFILEDISHTEWNRWDIRLAKAAQIHAEMTHGGVPIYWDRSDRVRFTAESYTSKSRAALDRAEDKARESKTKQFGKVFYPKAHSVDGGPLPTLEEFLEEQRLKKEMSSGKVNLTPGEFGDNSGWTPES